MIVLLSSCESGLGTPLFPNELPQITSLSVSPEGFEFTPSDGIKDTTLTFTFTIKVNDQDLLSRSPIVTLQDFSDISTIFSDSLTDNPSSNIFTGTTSITTNTGISFNIMVEATLVGKDNLLSNSRSQTVKIIGYSANSPVIETISLPDTVFIPAQGNQPFLIAAHVVHPDKQTLLDRVFIELIDNTSASLGEFTLFDDGNSTDSGDLVANDSTFTRRFIINSANQPDEITVIFKAIDKNDKMAETVTGNFVISN